MKELTEGPRWETTEDPALLWFGPSPEILLAEWRCTCASMSVTKHEFCYVVSHMQHHLHVLLVRRTQRRPFDLRSIGLALANSVTG